MSAVGAGGRRHGRREVTLRAGSAPHESGRTTLRHERTVHAHVELLAARMRVVSTSCAALGKLTKNNFLLL